MRPILRPPFVQVFILALLRPFFVLQDGAHRDGSTTPAAAALLNRCGCGATDEDYPSATVRLWRCACAVAALLQRRGAPTRLRTALSAETVHLQGYGQPLHAAAPPRERPRLRTALHTARRRGTPTRLRTELHTTRRRGRAYKATARRCTLHTTRHRGAPQGYGQSCILHTTRHRGAPQGYGQSCTLHATRSGTPTRLRTAPHTTARRGVPTRLRPDAAHCRTPRAAGHL